MVDSPILARIEQILTDYTLPSGRDFMSVVKGDALALTLTDGRPHAKFRYLRSQDAPEGPRVLSGNTMREDVFLIETFWPVTPESIPRGYQEEEIYSISHNLPEAFIDREGETPDYGSMVTVATYDQGSKSSTTEFYNLSDLAYRTFRFELRLRILEEPDGES